MQVKKNWWNQQQVVRNPWLLAAYQRKQCNPVIRPVRERSLRSCDETKDDGCYCEYIQRDDDCNSMPSSLVRCHDAES